MNTQVGRHLAGSGRVVLFGATGYTGRLAAEAMVRAGLAPVLAGRSATRLADLVAELAPFAPINAAPTWQVAEAGDQGSVNALLASPADVLVSTVGPFTRLGAPAITAAINAGASYVDSTGEPPFIREVFQTYGAQAQATGARLLTAFGYDYVPGNLAGALALQAARARGAVPTRVEIGYFVGGESFGMSSGTKASAAAIMLAPSFAFHHGAVITERSARSTSIFNVEGQPLAGLSVGGSEHFALSRFDQSVQNVDVYLGWAGKATRVASAASGAMSAVAHVPGLGNLMHRGLRSAAGDATGQGPTKRQRDTNTSIAVARTFDGVGRPLSRVQVTGPSPYTLTAELLAWAAAMCLVHPALSGGAFGPVDAFGLDALLRGCADMGLVPVKE
ncbi:MAG: saccharopine dehydrogenase NADP-binding domain-containing protein [Actinomycetota bacterium]|nr:saccharopine dehydrogenase NADP-binding domain-containing protein [Actinomycetota bacterium]